MTVGGSVSETRECGGDAAAYVLGALDPGEAEQFRRHLDSCAICRDEVASLRPVVDVLAIAVPQEHVPSGLRRRVMRDVRAEARATPHARLNRRNSRSVGRLALRPVLAVGMLATAALAVLGLQLADRGSSSERVVQASVAARAASAQLRLSGAHAELIVNHLPPPPVGRIYELWTQRPHQQPVPTRTLFSVSSSGAADVGVPGSVRGVGVIMVTSEPAGGSPRPTGAPVVVARLT
ncbi:MAG: anti-sigma factor [Solirubrobacterales bacterium]|nr:anti-sigma factor [Solirubrobacterales bacterium]MBV9472826.1 anti-sigma factor [Solirubrobacterales bacterium]MBV9838588.1 anti-sigma factor [Solirubrobacterales bacterium]